ncbi:MAG: serine/threonine protein kinase, partial [Chloroflexota bacterium]|nr:serine/threonine protein kinase [Chloroflexota bacterium]
MVSSQIYCSACGVANPIHAAFCFACGQPLHGSSAGYTSAQPSETLEGTLLQERYQLLERLGAGGFGAVYRAFDTKLGNRVVAVKEMSQIGLSPQEIIEASDAFKHEALLLANLMHPSLPRIYDHFSEGGHWYLVMDFIEGETLEHRLSHTIGKRLLNVEDILTIGIQLAGVLSYLHTRTPPIIFRDLKPANIMLTPDGNLYLIDFGIARLFKPGQMKDTIAFGSPGYAAPEQYG